MTVRFRQYALMLDDPTREKVTELAHEFGQTVSGMMRALILKEYQARQDAKKKQAAA
jgi:hypothetical protein